LIYNWSINKNKNEGILLRGKKCTVLNKNNVNYKRETDNLNEIALLKGETITPRRKVNHVE